MPDSSTVSVLTRPPRRRRLTSLPSLTARRPKVDSAILARRQYSVMSRRSASLIRRLSSVTSLENLVCAKSRVNHNVAHWHSGQLDGILPHFPPARGSRGREIVDALRGVKGVFGLGLSCRLQVCVRPVRAAMPLALM